MSELRAFHHVALSVSDLERSVAWYGSVLGFAVLFREDGDERKAAVMRFADGGFSVGLVQFGPTSPDRFDPHRVGLDHLAFAVGSRSDLDGWADRLTGSGVEHSGVVEVPSGAIMNFRDPDGIALALFWDRA